MRRGDGPTHGRRSTYKRHRCRCEACRDAEREYQELRRVRDRRRAGKATEPCPMCGLEFEWHIGIGRHKPHCRGRTENSA